MIESLQKLIDESRDLAIIHGQATLSGDYKSGNKAFDKLVSLIPEIRKYGKEGEKALLDLTEDNDDSVACWAATNLLKTHEPKALATLERIAKKPGIIAFDAEMVIKQWKKGELVLP